jgi:hypothetical protein
MKHAYFQRRGNQNSEFRRIVEYPFFTASELSNGVQLADLCAYNVYRAFKDERLDYDYFKLMLPYFYCRTSGEQLDGLKVWPEPSPLIAAAKKLPVPDKKKTLRKKGPEDGERRDRPPGRGHRSRGRGPRW